MSYASKQYLNSFTSKNQKDLMKSCFLENKKLKVEEIKNGYVLPPIKNQYGDPWCYGGILNENKEFVEISGQYAYGENDRVKGGYDISKYKINEINEEVIYLNYFIPQWGHYLLEVISRLWYIVKHSKTKIVYSFRYGEDCKIKGNYLQLLQILGISENRLIYVNEVTKFKKIIIPETSICVAKYYTKEYKQIIDKLITIALDEYKLKHNRRIYCSRKHFKNVKNKELNQDLIENIYKNNGYEIVYMEEHNLIEQIRLLNECSEVVCVSGTLVHNAMFIKNKKCRFTILNKTYKINPIIYLSNELSNAEFTFIDSYLAPLPISIGRGPFLLSITNELKEYCKDKDLRIEDYSLFNHIKSIIDYYFKYLKQYWRRIIKNQKISSGGFDKYEYSLKELRNNYKQEVNKIISIK